MLKLTVIPDRPSHPTRLGRCKRCKVVYQWAEHRDVRMGREHVWDGVACPGCKGPLVQTTSRSKDARCYARVETAAPPAPCSPLATVLLIGTLAAPALRTPAGAEARLVVEKVIRAADGGEKTARTEIAVRAGGLVGERLVAAAGGPGEVLVEGRLRLDDAPAAFGCRYLVEASRVEVQS